MHVVVVDPSRTVLLLVSRLLGAQGHVVHPFVQPLLALAHIRAHQEIDALITSIELEEMTGLQLCAKARAIAGTERPLYVILMSSSRERGRVAAALDSGADDFISKPPEREELYARLRAAERVITLQRDLFHLANTDPLTGLLNRRALFRQAEDARETAASGRFLTAVMIDIDHFKRINDTHGHDIGDCAIRAVAQQLKTSFAIAGRLGGEEFVGLIEGETLQQTASAAEQLRRSLEKTEIALPEGTLSLTISAGASLYRAGETVDTFFQRADHALYAAKSGGRNRVLTETMAAPLEGAHQSRLRQGARTIARA